MITILENNSVVILASEKEDTMKKILKADMGGLPLWLFCVVCVIYAFYVITGRLKTDLVSCISTVYICGTLCFKLGDVIPFVKKWLGGGIFFSIFGIAFINWLGIVPEAMVTAAKTFNNNYDFLNFAVAIIIAGSLLGMNRKVLINAGIRYFVPVIVGVLGTFVVSGLIGAVLGYGFSKTILYIAAPILGGGMSAGAVPLSQTYEAVLGVNAGDVISLVSPIFNVGNILAILMASVLAHIGTKKPQWYGDGDLMDPSKMKLSKEETKVKTRNGQIKDLVPGVIASISIYMVGMMIGQYVKSIHGFAWTIILAAILKISNVVPESIEDSCAIAQGWVSKELLPLMMAGIGFALIDFNVIIEVFKTPAIFILCIVVVVVVTVITAFVGKLVGFYPLESAVTAGLCMANAGGTGDIATLGAYHHMELMPFAALSSRLGGAILIVIMSVLAPVLQNLM